MKRTIILDAQKGWYLKCDDANTMNVVLCSYNEGKKKEETLLRATYEEWKKGPVWEYELVPAQKFLPADYPQLTTLDKDELGSWQQVFDYLREQGPKPKRKTETLEFWGRNVHIFTEKNTQTINICTEANDKGLYEYKIRLCKLFVSLQDIGTRSLDEFVTWLMTDRKGKMEINMCNTSVELGCVDGKPTVEVFEKLSRVVDMIPSTDDAEWINKAKEITELCINELVKEFVEIPYLHRVEHSIHTRLYELLHSKDHFKVYAPLLGEQQRTQHIHKEWPESDPREGKGNRRGNFDMAILHAGQIGFCSLSDFSKGLLRPPVAIELGLNYGMDHLRGDAEKLNNSKIQHSYLIHLVNDSDQVAKAKVGEVIKDLNLKFPTILIAFAQVYKNTTHIKLLKDKNIVIP